MLGKFTETNKLEEIQDYLMDGKIIFSFRGNSFRMLAYKSKFEIGIIKSYDIAEQMEEQIDECNYERLNQWIYENIKENNCYHMLYDGAFKIEDKIYNLIREFYNLKAYSKIAYSI